MITIEQCRGARGLLGWTQQDLADASGLSKTAINNYEKAHSDIKTESLRAIRMAFESAEIEFLSNNGVCKKTEHARILHGKDALSEILEDIQETVKHGGGDIRISNVDKSLAGQVSTQTLFNYIETLKTLGIRERILCSEGTKSVLTPSDDCRWLSTDTEMSRIPTFIYGSKVALQMWDQTMFVIISSADAYAAEKKRFDAIWAASNALPENASSEPAQSSAST